MKKLINDPDAVVKEALEGIEAAHGDVVRVIHDPMVIVRADAPVQGKVGIISGGGSGHEPMHGGFVGKGMLDAACPGEVFTSPTPDQMLEATEGGRRRGRRPAHRQELHRRRAQLRDGRRPRQGRGHRGRGGRDQRRRRGRRTASTPPGRRGVGITVIAEKICGAAAEDGQSLAEVAELCRKVNGQGRSMGMALTPCITPGSGRAQLRARRRRDGDRHRHPRRAGPPPRDARAGVRGRRAARHRDRRGPAVRVGRQRARVRQRHGRHAADRALHRLPRAQQLPGRARHHDRAQPDRQLHHLARDGGLLDHAAQARRRADALVGRARRHAGPQSA